MFWLKFIFLRAGHIFALPVRLSVRLFYSPPPINSECSGLEDLGGGVVDQNSTIPCGVLMLIWRIEQCMIIMFYYSYYSFSI